MEAYEVTGTVDDRGHVQLDSPLPVDGTFRLRGILMLEGQVREEDEQAWLHAAAQSDAYAFLKDPAEDIYSSNDGKPFNDTR
jgi:hypothetical protein